MSHFVMVMACKETSNGSTKWGMVRGLGILLQTFAECKRLFPVDLAPTSLEPLTALSCPTTASCTLGHSWNVFDNLCVTGRKRMENGLFKTDMFVSVLEGTDCEFCLQHPIFGFLFL